MTPKKKIEQETEKQAKKPPKLTARERKILELMAEGTPYREAAEASGVPKDKLAREQRRLAEKVVFTPWPQVLRQGIKDKAVQKVLKEGLKAEKVVAVRILGQKRKELLTLPDHDVRMKAAELVIKYSQEHQSSVPVTINVVAMGAAKTNILVVPQQPSQIAGSVQDLEETGEPNEEENSGAVG